MLKRNAHKVRLTVLISGLIILLLPGIAASQEPPESLQAKKDRIEAERLWEQMVKVKGGRDKLHSISNMMLTKGNDADGIQIQFYVYPNKFWAWSKNKGLHNLMFITMANLDLGVFMVAGHRGLATDQKNLSETDRTDYREGYLMETCAFLLETKWLKPTPIRVRRQTVGGEKLDVVETHFTTLEKYRGWRLDFYIDPESLVVRGVEHYGDDGKPYSYYSFGDYTSADGIRVPLKYGAVYTAKEAGNATLVPITFRFNLDYDRTLFEHPPSPEAGPDAWRPKP